MPKEQELKLTLKVDDQGTVVLDKFSKSIQGIDKSTKDMSSSLGLIRFDSIINLGERAFRTGEQIYNLGKEVASSLNDIDRLSKVAGISASEFQKMSYAAKMTDVETGDLAVGLKKLSVNMDEASRGSGEAADVFKRIGISVVDSSGRLKSLDRIMMEIADKFATWEDGPRKIAIAIDLLGKSGERLVPYLNKGSAGMREFYEEAERLGIKLDESIIKKGSELEDRYKKFEAWWDGFKKRFVIGIYEIIEDLEKLNKYEFVHPSQGLIKKTAPLDVEAEKAALVGGSALGGGTKLTPPPERAKALTEENKALEENARAWGNYAQEIIDSLEKMQLDEVAEQKKKWLEIDNALLAVQGALAEKMANEMFPAQDEVNKIIDKTNKYAEEQRKLLLEIQGLVKDFGWEDYAAGLDAASEGTRQLNIMMISNQENAKKISEQTKMAEDLFSGFVDTFSSSFSVMRRSGESFSDWFKKMWLDMADYAIRQLQKIAMNYVFYGNASGNKETGGGLMGLIGGLFSGGGTTGAGGGVIGWLGGLIGLQHGGLVMQPGLYGLAEKGPEAVIPLDKMGMDKMGQGGNTVIVMNIEATDVDSFERKYGPSVNKIFRHSARRGGAARKNMRNYL